MNIKLGKQSNENKTKSLENSHLSFELKNRQCGISTFKIEIKDIIKI